MIRNYAVKVSIQAKYDDYLQRQVDHYQDYVAGKAGAMIGRDMEVAEAPTRVTGSPEAAVAIGLTVGGEPSRAAVMRVGCGCHAQSGEPVTARDVSLNGERTAYQDLVFSVPKSVSVEFAAARAAGDERRAQQLIDAMTASVEEAIGNIQELIPLGRRRVGIKGVQIAVPAKVVALLDVHSAARPVAGQTSGDPQLHVHARLLNLGLQPEGQVASVNFWMLYQNIRALNGVFEAGMRTRLEDLGYPTVDASHGERRQWSSFELERQLPSLSAQLSSRQDRIETLAQEVGHARSAQLLATLQIAAAVQGGVGTPGRPVTALTQRQRALCKPTPREVEALSRASREAKLVKTRGELAEEWGGVVAAHRYQHLPSEPPPPGCRSGPRQRQREMVEVARLALSDRGLVAGRSVFDRGDILEFVAQEAVGRRLDEAELRLVVERVERKAVRLQATPHEYLGAFTTREQQRLETESVSFAVALADEATVSVPDAVVGRALAQEARSSGHSVDAEQEAAVRALCSPAGWVQMVGVAGSGKTTVCKPAVTALKEAGYQVLGVSLSQGATDVLAAETGIPCWNLADFVTRVENSALRTTDGTAVSLTPTTVILLDEAGTVESRRWHEFTRICDRWHVAGVRVLGDPEQSQPVGSGSILGWLSRHLPTTYLATNYRQGEGTLEADGARLLRDGKGVEFLRLKDQGGQLWIDADAELSVARAAETWAVGIAGGGDPKQHILLADLVDVSRQLNRHAREEYDRMGRLGPERVVAQGREWAVGDRVVFTGTFKEVVPRVDENGTVMLRRDGTAREQTIRIPRRTQGEVVGFEYRLTEEEEQRTVVDRAARRLLGRQEKELVLQIRTDSRGQLPSRTAAVPARQDVLDYGYAMTTTVAQGRTWDITYRLLTASRLTGRQQEYPAGTRHITSSVLFGDLRSVFAEAQGDLSAREDAIAKYGNLISRDVAKVSTLDYASGSDRAILEERLTPKYLRPPSVTLRAPMSERQASYLQALHQHDDARSTWKLDPRWSWVRASVEIDLAGGHRPGEMALEWLRTMAVPDHAAWTAVDTACRAAGAINPRREPAPDTPVHVTPQWDTAAMVEAARVARQPGAATPGVPPQPAATPPTAPLPDADVPRQRREKKVVEMPEGWRPEKKVVEMPPDAQAPRRAGVKAPKPMDDEERRRRDQLTREAAEQARQRAQREHGPHAS